MEYWEAFRERFLDCTVGCYVWASSVLCPAPARPVASFRRTTHGVNDGEIADDDDEDEDETMVDTSSSTPLVGRRPTISEELTMSPLEKFRKYRRFPFKLLLNFAVATLITVFMVFNNQQYTSFVNSSSDAYRTLLKNDNYDTLSGKNRIYNYSNLQSCLQTATQRYFDLPSTSLFPVTVEDSLTMVLSYRNGTQLSFELTPAAPLGPFDAAASQAQWLLLHLMNVDIKYRINSTQPSYSGSGHYDDLSYHWVCSATYDFSTGGGSVLYAIDVAAYIETGTFSIIVKLDSAIMALCFVSVLLTIRALRRSYRVFDFARKSLSQPRRLNDAPNALKWSRVSFMDKVAFFNLWYAMPFSMHCASLTMLFRHFSTLLDGTLLSAHSITPLTRSFQICRS